MPKTYFPNLGREATVKVERYWASGLAMILIGGAGALIGLSAIREIATGVMQIIMMMAGAAFFSGLVVFFNLLTVPRSAPIIQFNFNDQELRHEVREVIDADFVEIEPYHKAPWVTTAETIVRDDPILALAKTRIDLEQDLRRLALSENLLRSDQRLSVSRLAEMLAREGLVSKTVHRAILAILPICNRAVHGEEIDLRTAQMVIDTAKEVSIVLRGKAHH